MLGYLFAAVVAIIILFSYKFINQRVPPKQIKLPETSKNKEKTKQKQQPKRKSPSAEPKKEATKEEVKELNTKKEDKKKEKKVEDTKESKTISVQKEGKNESKNSEGESDSPVVNEKSFKEAPVSNPVKDTAVTKNSTSVQEKEGKKQQKQQQKPQKVKPEASGEVKSSNSTAQNQDSKSTEKVKSEKNEKNSESTKEQPEAPAISNSENNTAEKKESDAKPFSKTQPKFKTVKPKQHTAKIPSPEEVAKPAITERKEKPVARNDKPKQKEDKDEKKEEAATPTRAALTDQNYQEIAKEKLESERKKKEISTQKKDSLPEVKILAPTTSTKTWSLPEQTVEVTSIDNSYFPKLGEKKSKQASEQNSSTSNPQQSQKIDNPHKRGGELSFEIMLQAPDEKRMKRSNPEEEEGRIPIHFSCTIEPADQIYDSWQMYVIGSCPELGDYQIDKGLTMDRSQNVFTATLECFESDRIEYQYAFVDTNDNSNVKYSEKKSFEVGTETKELNDLFTLQ